MIAGTLLLVSTWPPYFGISSLKTSEIYSYIVVSLNQHCLSRSPAYITGPSQTDTAIDTHWQFSGSCVFLDYKGGGGSCKLYEEQSRDTCCAGTAVSSTAFDHVLFKVSKLTTKAACVYNKLYWTILKMV